MWGWVGGWGELGPGHTFSPRLSKPLSGLGSGIKKNGLSRGKEVGKRRGVDEKHPVTPSQKATGIFSGSPIPGRAHRHCGTAQIQRPRRGLASGGKQQGGKLLGILSSTTSNPQPGKLLPISRPLNGTENGEQGPPPAGSEETVVRQASWPEMGQCSFNRPLLQTLGAGEVAALGDKRIRISKLCSNLGSWTLTLQGPSSMSILPALPTPTFCLKHP